MSKNFLFMGTVTTTAVNQAFPFVDGTGSSAVTATTIALATAASSAALDRYKDFALMVMSGSGAGQMRIIKGSSTAAITVATVKEWDAPQPDTASTFLVGVPIAGRDGMAVKAEETAASTTGAWRGLFVTKNVTPEVVMTTSFQLGAPTSSYQVAFSSSASVHMETRVIDYLGPLYGIGKVYCDIAPTASIEMFAGATFTLGRINR